MSLIEASLRDRDRHTGRRGIAFVISGPSGVGKGTIVRELVTRDANLTLSVSVTTREPRVGEKDGIHYHFRSVDQFQGLMESGQLLEYAQYAKGYYGTPRGFVENQLHQGFDVILEIDTKGAIQVKERLPHAVYIFVLPPTMDELAKRLAHRQTEAAEAVRTRIAIAHDELNYLPFYDYQVVNDELDLAIEKVQAIMMAEHCKVTRHLAR